MLTNDAFGQLLNLPKPWEVERMQIDHQTPEAHVWLVHGSSHFACPKCGASCPVHDHTAVRTWRHLDLWGRYKTGTIKMVPLAHRKIVHDRFHVAMHMGKAVDRVRVDEHRALMVEHDQSLKGTKH